MQEEIINYEKYISERQQNLLERRLKRNPNLIIHTIPPDSNSIERIDISDTCLFTYPCQHTSTIYYTNGTQELITLSGKFLAETYFDKLDLKGKKHLSQYI